MSGISRFAPALLLVLALVSPGALGEDKRDAELAKLCPAGGATLAPGLADPSLSEAILTASRSRVLVVAYDRCRMRILSGCSAPGSYRFTATNRSRLTDYVLNRRDLFAKLPLDASGLDSALARGGVMSLRQASVGFYEAPVPDAKADRLKGDCQGATHIVSKLDMGAFVLEAKTPSPGGPVADELRKTGVVERCLISTTDAQSEACSAVLRVTLVPVEGASAMPVSEPHPLLNQFPGPARVRRLEAGSLGKSMSLPEPGKATLLLFWGPASPGSLKALGELEALSRDFDPDRILAVGVAVDTNDLAARNALSGLSIRFPLAIDDGSFKRRYQTTGKLPEIFVIDAEGYVRYYASGDGAKPPQAAAAARFLLKGRP